jgi:hypothetical protein
VDGNQPSSACSGYSETKRPIPTGQVSILCHFVA